MLKPVSRNLGLQQIGGSTSQQQWPPCSRAESDSGCSVDSLKAGPGLRLSARALGIVGQHVSTELGPVRGSGPGSVLTEHM